MRFRRTAVPLALVAILGVATGAASLGAPSRVSPRRGTARFTTLERTIVAEKEKDL